MSYYEYRVVPAPRTLAKVKGFKEPESRYGHVLETALNAEGREGWEFQRIEAVTAAVKRGLFGRTRPETMTVMVFRRWVELPAATSWQDSARGADDPAAAYETTIRDDREEVRFVRHTAEPPLRSFRNDERS